ncbi:hypothetical protein SLAV_39265 [Streptomyces lavendulae subsp. lavendulae]|uniref:Uncharacterized protein n=1 Tax=Streptomyces lavendulae subsp. lavendulae TaxID=58340 RepID=A0A2K8P8L8_STRLA|nr:hypothetical protein [Streptomyces lavendulae]ATZ21955.1 hypothetical protein SLAV_00125 [Streptomyces lavendulae subsp. lavendulae]ATZ29616.1 hypothetical protein SLAV_39265 [Streptomyces lavendulae subsp. lavendulae]
MNTTTETLLAAAAALAVATAPTAAAAAAAPAAATLSYRCSTSTQTIDDAGYSGPAPDNWDIKIQVCVARSGSTVHTYADITWDGPAFYAAKDATIFDGAKVRLQIMKSRQGTDPVVVEREFEIKDRLEKATSGGDRDGHYRTPAISHLAGSGAYGNAVLYLDWHKDGRGYRGHDYKGSPTV